MYRYFHLQVKSWTGTVMYKYFYYRYFHLQVKSWTGTVMYKCFYVQVLSFTGKNNVQLQSCSIFMYKYFHLKIKSCTGTVMYKYFYVHVLTLKNVGFWAEKINSKLLFLGRIKGMLESTVGSGTPWRATSRWYRSIIFYRTYFT